VFGAVRRPRGDDPTLGPAQRLWRAHRASFPSSAIASTTRVIRLPASGVMAQRGSVWLGSEVLGRLAWRAGSSDDVHVRAPGRLWDVMRAMPTKYPKTFDCRALRPSRHPGQRAGCCPRHRQRGRRLVRRQNRATHAPVQQQ
jgi:hypothetical protein